MANLWTKIKPREGSAWLCARPVMISSHCPHVPQREGSSAVISILLPLTFPLLTHCCNSGSGCLWRETWCGGITMTTPRWYRVMPCWILSKQQNREGSVLILARGVGRVKQSEEPRKKKKLRKRKSILQKVKKNPTITTRLGTPGDCGYREVSFIIG